MSPSGKRRLDRVNSKAEATTGQGIYEIASEHGKHSLAVSGNSNQTEDPARPAWKPVEVTRLLGLLLLSLMTMAAVLLDSSFAWAFVVTTLIVFASLFGVARTVRDSLL